MRDDHEKTDPVWTRVNDELERRRAKHQLPASWADVARAFTTSEQRLNNWRRRRVPPSAYGQIADLLGWTVDQVAGRDSPPKQSQMTGSASADEILTLLSYFKQLPDGKRSLVIEFARDQGSRRTVNTEIDANPKLKAAKAKVPKALQDEGAISKLPTSESSGARVRKGRK